MDTTEIQPPRRWLTIEQLVAEFPAYSAPAVRSLIQRSRPHYNTRGEWVEGNGLAGAICQPGGKNGKIMIDGLAFARWLEQWTHMAAANTTRINESVAA